eukprot:SAG22_NODE_1113_length_5533_cov_5.884063_2_plen_72_part_00
MSAAVGQPQAIETPYQLLTAAERTLVMQSPVRTLSELAVVEEPRDTLSLLMDGGRAQVISVRLRAPSFLRR